MAPIPMFLDWRGDGRIGLDDVAVGLAVDAANKKESRGGEPASNETETEFESEENEDENRS